MQNSTRGTQRRGGLRAVRFERLEDRNLLAGDITASVIGGQLTLVGDNAANQVQVKEVGTNRWRVQGLGTEINGSSARTFSGVTSINADLNGGNDFIQILDGRLPGALTIRTDGGNDTVQLINLNVFTLYVQTAGGIDTVSVNNVRSTAYAGIFTGAGVDAVSVDRLHTGLGEIYTRGGNDSVSMTRSSFNDLDIRTHGGTDSVALNDVSAANALAARLGAGNNDSLSVVRSRATVASFFGGGGSGDVLVRSLNDFGTQVVAGFETVV